jgi:GNAT superfamily N-acetyltransferase
MIMRSIHLEEVDALLVMMRAMQADDPWSVPFVEFRARAAVELMLSNPSYGQGWFIEDDGRRVGYIILSFDFSLEYGGRNAWVDEFFIERESRSQGLGAQALEFFERAAIEAGATAIHLEVNEGNRAIELYRRRGFEDHHRYLMTKWLAK